VKLRYKPFMQERLPHARSRRPPRDLCAVVAHRRVVNRIYEINRRHLGPIEIGAR
jgi:hypothetical protein